MRVLRNIGKSCFIYWMKGNHVIYAKGNLNSHNFFLPFVKIINCDPSNAIFAYMYKKFNLFVISIIFSRLLRIA